MKIHLVFSVVKLIPFNETEIPEQKATPPPAPVLVDGVEEYEVEEIIDSQKRRGKTQYLVKWKGFPSEENTWEPSTMIKEDVPALVKCYHDRFPEAIWVVQSSKLLIKRLSEFAKLPTRGSD